MFIIYIYIHTILLLLYIYISYTEWIPRINVQGVFMKRQREASQKMAELICKNVVDARAMLHYMMRSPSSTGDGRNRQVSWVGMGSNGGCAKWIACKGLRKIMKLWFMN